MRPAPKNNLISFTKAFLGFGFSALIFSWVIASRPLSSPGRIVYSPVTMLADSDTIKLPYPFKDRISDEESTGSGNQFSLSDPANVTKTVEYNTEENYYDINESIGKMYYRNPNYLTFDEYVEKEFRQAQKDYFIKRADEENVVKKNALIPSITVESEVFDRLFGGNTVDIRPNGSAELIFGLKRSTNENPSLPVRSQKPPPQFDFDQKIQMNVIGHIGDKLKLTMSYNTESQFDFENQMKIEYTGYDDDIVRKIELGNVSLPLTGSLITGSQSLFGIKTALQFGRLSVVSIYSQQKGEKKTVESQGGAQTSFFEVRADQYEANRHYFLSQFFRNEYDQSLINLPQIKSRANITRVEVWVTKKIGTVDNIRNVVALMDLGETKIYNPNVTFPGGIQIGPDTIANYPSNYTNNAYRNLSKNSNVRNLNSVSTAMAPMGYNNAEDYEKLEARLLPQGEYTLNDRLGYISLNQALNPNEVLAVSFEYTVAGETFRVGEFSNGGISAPSTLIVKLLKGTVFTTKLPTWDLMMKNIYNIGAYQVNKDDFKLQVIYSNASTGIPINYLPAGSTEAKVDGVPLIRLVNLDRLNAQSDPYPDGDFDFVEGITINSNRGRIIFPVLEPFGSHLRNKFSDQLIANTYAFDFLYDSTKTRAQQDLLHNRYSLKGSYKSASSSEISLGAFNIPQGAVTVTAGGVKLVENTDYTVDYNMGKVRIINPAYLNSNTPVKVDLESNSLFNQQTKTLFGSRLDYMISKDFTVGGTFLHLNERPLTQKVNIGDESISNTIWGLDGTYKTESRLITRILDAMPLYSTKEKSSVMLSGEFARLNPGHNKQIGSDGGTAYIDDFEGAKSTLDIKSYSAWSIASIPDHQPTLFPEATYSNDRRSGYNRAKLAWYVIDPFFYDSKAPDHIRTNSEALSNHYSRQVLESEIFPNKENNQVSSLNLAVLNLAMYPKERGPYNFDVLGMNADGTLRSPQQRWGGMMRKLETTDFEATNVEFIEFWLMDPFIYNPASSGGDLYFNLGNVSEDILKDGIKTFENGLNTTELTVTTPPSGNTIVSDTISVWGRIPLQQSLTTAFDNDEASRVFQDVGLDGLGNENEKIFFSSYINSVNTINGTAAYNTIISDPAGDIYHHFRGTDYDDNEVSILNRYKNYNGLDGNSPTTSNSPESYPTSANTLPDVEDINKDGLFNESEAYYQYKVSLRPVDMVVGKNYITDNKEATVKLSNGQTETINWYQFKIPVADVKAQQIGGIEDFHSIGFVRMFLKGFSDSIICRFGKLQLVRSDWRRFPNDVPQAIPGIPSDNDKTKFDVTTVSYEENERREPVNYDLPPGIERSVNPTGNNQIQHQNEQSIALKICDLEDGHGRAAYKNINYDIRNYKRIRMFIHSEDGIDGNSLKPGDLTAFIRLGSDFTQNYYEYEVPLNPSNWGRLTREEIWLDSISVQLEKFYKLKLERSVAMSGNPNLAISDVFSRPDGANTISVVGSPRLNEIRTVMLGVRNPFRYQANDVDDGLSKCAEVWFDELRVTDFEDEGGWAANARTSIKLADLGQLNLTGTHKSYNWGSLEQKLNDRAKHKETSYDASASIELSKFLPEKTRLKIPMFVGYSEIWKRPMYDPNDPDIPYEEATQYFNDSLKKAFIHKTEDYTVRRSLNFTNVKRERSQFNTNPHFYDVSNLSLTYAFTDEYNRSESIEYKKEKEYRGGVAYVFSQTPKNIAPLSKSKKLKSNWLKIFKDFNFQYSPNSVAVRTDLNRQYSETLMRNTTGFPFPLDTNVSKLFSMNRVYDVKFDLTKNLKTDFQATNFSRIDEQEGPMNRRYNRYDTQVDTIKRNLYGVDAPFGGRTTEYKHNGNVNYAVPINKLPAFDWITSTLKYGFEYGWMAAPLIYDTIQQKMVQDLSIGNTIKNSNTKQGNLNLNFTTLYNKVGYFKRVNQKKPGQKFPKILKPIKTKQDTIDMKQDSIFQESSPGIILRTLSKGLMMLKTGNLTYSETNGYLLPGYLEKTEFIGMSPGFRAPTTGFIVGSQKPMENFASDRDWITKDPNLNLPIQRTLMQNLQAKIGLEPLLGLKIDLTGTRNFSRNQSEYYRYDPSTDEFDSFSKTESGNFSISYLSYRTSFEKQVATTDSNNYKSESFENFRSYRKIISTRLAAENPNSTRQLDTLGYEDGYSGVSQEVLIPAFLAAYSGSNPETQGIGAGDKNKNIFPKIPLPNWRISYDGLSKMPFSKKYFNSVTLSHSYRSTYSVNSYTSSTEYKIDNSARNDTGDFRSKYEVAQVSINEQFSPFFGVDVNWKSNWTTKFDYKRDRALSLSLTNTQVNETRGNEYVFGVGYKWKNFKVPFKVNRKTVRLKNDLILKVDYSIRRSLTITRQLVQETVQTTGGMVTKKLGFSADYMVNERFNLRLFYDWTRNVPELSTSFPTTNWNGGISIRFTISG